MVFPFATRTALTRPQEPLPIIAFERPQQTHAMRLPARGRSLKLNRQSNIRRSAGVVRVSPVGPPPCNFAVVAVDFPPPTPTFKNRGTTHGTARASRHTGATRNSAAASLLENCHIGLARVTMLATMASARHALGQDLNFFSLFSRQKLATRVSRRHAAKLAAAVTPDSCSAA
jgi:hypothetical protein